MSRRSSAEPRAANEGKEGSALPAVSSAASRSGGSRNLVALSIASFLTDLSSEMVLRLLPLYLVGTLGLKANVIGLIEGVAESTASLLRLVSGSISDRLGSRKWPAVLGYGISALAKPFFLLAGTWGSFALVRWGERVGKGVRVAPRDALLADSVCRSRRGLAYGLHRAADTAGAVVGLGVAIVVVWRLQGDGLELRPETFRTIILLSLLPASLAVVVLALGAREVARKEHGEGETSTRRGLGRPFYRFLIIAGLFDLGNSADAFLVLRASERGLSVLGVLAMLLSFNLVYAFTSTPGGWLSDRLGRLPVLLAGWFLYAVVYLGLALVETGLGVWAMALLYGAYYGLTHGTAKALIADLVPAARRGTAFGLYGMLLGLLDLPASVIAGVLWQGLGSWPGWGPAAPFFFGAGTAFLAALLLLGWGKTQRVR